MKLSKVYKAENLKEARKICPKGYRLPKIWELVKLACEKNKKIFDTEECKWIFFWGETHRLARDINGDWNALWYDSFNPNANGRAVFIKEEGK